ncbi:hypothetical protein SAMN00808754_1420 [Thermanaeromonas toyohensis ToBE]|uniref:Uncharacterized protein n=1 Tax=Thermanaeromonas toyohensis ToBE TaxID=698762 RepID=A0A1W1VSI5_9FIRM|nr:hypothetical protein [Thermanaeromonas toyohensis]SMB96190.1 hypothetical protein SAMN00808754_1420 [Thermanaeromonas toyohensis ToBE]
MDEKGFLRELLLLTDQEVHNHLRDTDQKRDHLLELYLKLVFTLFSAAAGLEFLNVSWNATTLVIVNSILGIALLFGEAVYFAMISARKWHAEYVNVHLLIQAALTTEDLCISPQAIPKEKRHPFLPSLYTSRSFILVQLCNAGIIMLMGSLSFKTFQHTIVLLISGLAAIILFFLNTIRGSQMLKKAESDFWEHPEDCWIITGLALKKFHKTGG